jgi:hypothetical protein
MTIALVICCVLFLFYKAAPLATLGVLAAIIMAAVVACVGGVLCIVVGLYVFGINGDMLPLVGLAGFFAAPTLFFVWIKYR